MYHNTNNEAGQTLRGSQKKASRQEDIILEIFKKGAYNLYTPDEVHEISGLNCPVTSIRRAMTNLMNQTLLVKTKVMRAGKYGKDTHCYELNREAKQLGLF